MKKYNRVLIAILALFVSLAAVSQEKKSKIVISGFVTDSLNSPMSNVSIFLDNIDTKEKTNSKGYFKLRTKKTPKNIVAKSLNYGVEKIVYNEGEKVINIVFKSVSLKPEALAHKNQKRRKKTKEKRVYLDMKDYLNSINGLYISHSQSNNTSPSRDRITLNRGSNSLGGASEEVLFVLDGTPISIENLLTMNPNEIRSVKVLKGANNYGIRGSNGVVELISIRF